jgi:hypothetical protein
VAEVSEGPAQTPGLFYHYTSGGALREILEHGQIWATHTQFLNDAGEFSYAFELARRVLPEIESEVHIGGSLNAVWDSVFREARQSGAFGNFVASFSREPDLLSQWRAYCEPGNGYAIGFRLSDISKLNGDWFAAQECSYDAEAHRKRIRTHYHHAVDMRDLKRRQNASDIEAETAAARHFVHLLFDLVAPSMKHPTFREERERRLRMVRPASDLWNAGAYPWPANVDVRFRAGRYGLVPYVPLALPEKSDGRGIGAIIVGPTPYPDRSVLALRALLARWDIHGVELENSGIPFRNW